MLFNISSVSFALWLCYMHIDDWDYVTLTELRLVQLFFFINPSIRHEFATYLGVDVLQTLFAHHNH
jgi:hypothetical protein